MINMEGLAILYLAAQSIGFLAMLTGLGVLEAYWLSALVRRLVRAMQDRRIAARLALLDDYGRPVAR